MRYTWVFNPNPKFGNTSEQILGKTDAELLGNEKAAELTQIKRSVLKKGRGTRREVKIPLEGGAFYFDLNVEPRRDEAGRMVGLSCAAFDLTEGKLLETSLRKSEQKYSLAESLAHIGHWERDFSEDRASWSPELFRIFGINPQDGAPNLREFMNLVHPQDRNRLQHKLDSIMFSAPKKKPILIEYRIIRPDGKKRFLSTTVQPVLSSNGRSVTLRGTLQDITDRRILENRITSISKAERASLQRDLHDTVCQQLTGLAFLAEEIKQDLFKLPHQAALDLEKIIEINQTALGQAKEIARGLTPLTDEPGALVNALREMARYVSLTYRIPCRWIPPQRILPLDSLTSTQMYFIAREAAVNAARHAQGRLIRITLSYRGNSVTVRVTDDGRGLDPVQMRKQGLGLETMKQRADLIGARLRISLGKKRGTVVECNWKKRITKGE